MHFNDYITSFLIQKRECRLPGLGVIRLEQEPAIYDVVHRVMKAPQTKVAFVEEEGGWEDELLAYFQSLTGGSQEPLKGRLDAWIEEVKVKISQGGELIFPTLGSLEKKEGRVVFVPNHSWGLYPDIAAVRAHHKEQSHSMVVGDRETTPEEMTRHIADAQKGSGFSFWKVAAIALLVVGAALVAWYLYSGRSLGNQTKIQPQPPVKSYITK